MSVVRLLVLGVVRLHGQTHGYAVHRELVAWRVETWTSVRPGSIYHALKQLTREGLLQAIGTENSAEGPGRMIYALSPSGEAEFLTLVEAALISFDLENLGAGVAFMQALPRQRVLDLLRTLQIQATANRHHLDTLVPDHQNRATPPHTADLLELWSGGLGATAHWAGKLIERLEAGDYIMAGEA